MFRFRRSSESTFPISLYEPKYLPEDSVLWSELLKRSEKAFKPLKKRDKVPYPVTGSAAECSQWWWANGKKDPKTALAIMAHFYMRSVEQRDASQCQNLQLASKIKSQDDELNLLHQNLSCLQEQNKNLKAENVQLMRQRLSEEQKSENLSRQNKFLTEEVRKRADENAGLREKNWEQTETLDDLKGQIHFLKYNAEHLEAETVRLTERLTASEEKSQNLLQKILSLVEKQEDAGLLNAEENAISTRHAVRSQNPSPLAVPLIVVIRMDAGRGGCHIGIIQNAAEICRSLNIPADRGLEFLMRLMQTQGRLSELKWRDECENCSRTGHAIEDCRRPGGGAEVGLYDCYTCGMHGHWARNCWLYKN